MPRISFCSCSAIARSLTFVSWERHFNGSTAASASTQWTKHEHVHLFNDCAVLGDCGAERRLLGWTRGRHVDVLLAGNGVCRDYAHPVVTLLRAVNVPARLVAVYAPGLSPMDFHAVAEAYVD